LPYGETNCKWDSKIDLEEFWKEFKRIRKSKKVACIHFCSTRFGYTLIKSNEAMFKMDMVWKKRNKTGGLQSRLRPMRNHEMVYFFYEQAPKYNRDKYHKRIQAVKKHDVEQEEKPKRKTIKDRKAMCEPTGIYAKENQTATSFDPPNPASVVEEKYNSSGYKKELVDGIKNFGTYGFDPPNPASVVEEKTVYGIDKEKAQNSGRKDFKGIGTQNAFEPPNPASVISEAEKDVWGETKFSCGGDCGRLNEDGSYKLGYEPPNPPSVFESTKVFIGKRHHQTEKPQDILEFFIKYWTDEGQTILDPTMGSGSTGVACKRLKRNFIGFEMDEKIYKVAEERIKKVETII